MLIPHGHDKMYSLQLNWLMILFLSGILFSAVALSGYGLYLQNHKKMEVERLRNLYGVNYGSALELHKTTKEIIESNEELFNNFIKIADKIGIPDNEKESFPEISSIVEASDTSLLYEILNNKELRPGFNYLPTVYSLKTLHLMMMQFSPLYGGMDEKISRGGIGIYSDMPVGRPLVLNSTNHDTSGFGPRPDPVSRTGLEFHSGFDISGPMGTPVLATGPGTVSKVLYNDPGYGNAVILQHKFGYYTLFAHMSKTTVATGMKINKGKLIGYLGRTGRVTGPHLHYEIWQGYQNRINPMPLICSIDLNSSTCRKFNSSRK